MGVFFFMDDFLVDWGGYNSFDHWNLNLMIIVVVIVMMVLWHGTGDSDKSEQSYKLENLKTKISYLIKSF